MATTTTSTTKRDRPLVRLRERPPGLPAAMSLIENNDIPTTTSTSMRHVRRPPRASGPRLLPLPDGTGNVEHRRAEQTFVRNNSRSTINRSPSASSLAGKRARDAICLRSSKENTVRRTIPLRTPRAQARRTPEWIRLPLPGARSTPGRNRLLLGWNGRSRTTAGNRPRFPRDTSFPDSAPRALPVSETPASPPSVGASSSTLLPRLPDRQIQGRPREEIVRSGTTKSRPRGTTGTSGRRLLNGGTVPEGLGWRVLKERRGHGNGP
jgi:hypothetical protein